MTPFPNGDATAAVWRVEPMTCAPDAFNSGESLITLKPGQAHSGTWGISPHPKP